MDTTAHQTPKQYAENKGVSPQSVYARIKRGTLNTIIEDGVTYIDETTTKQKNTAITQSESLQNQFIINHYDQLINLYELTNEQLHKDIKHQQKRISKLEKQVDKKNRYIESILTRQYQEEQQRKKAKKKKK